MISNLRSAAKQIKNDIQNNVYLLNISYAMLVWFWMNFLYSLASYGLSSYEWYLFGGLSVALKNIADAKAYDESINESYSAEKTSILLTEDVTLAQGAQASL